MTLYHSMYSVLLCITVCIVYCFVSQYVLVCCSHFLGETSIKMSVNERVFEVMNISELQAGSSPNAFG